jgi:pantothenate kinase
MADGRIVELAALAEAIEARQAGDRLLIAVAGPPGAGKSTLADALVERLNAGSPGSAEVLPMDGYHYDDIVLSARGLRPRKGAPETFDVGGLAHMLARLRRNEEPEIAVPVFDRSIEIARAGARLIPRTIRRLVVEGNYLLLDQAPWSQLHRHFDLTVMIAVPEAILRQRLIGRWESFGLTPGEIEAKVDGNDLPNGRFVIGQSIRPDYVVPFTG